jgi:hypothetical protein
MEIISAAPPVCSPPLTVYHTLRVVFLDRLFETIIVPIARRCHEWGVFELAFFLGAFLLVADGHRYVRGADAGTMVALTGCILSLPCLVYSTLVSGGRAFRAVGGELAAQLLYWWVAACWLPCAIHFASALFAWGVVLAIYSFLGFGVAVGRLCIYIGFDDRNKLVRCVIASYVLVTAFVVAHVAYAYGGVGMGMGLGTSQPAVLAVLASPVQVMGSVVLLLGLLIGSSAYYEHATTFNVLMIVTLCAFELVGHTLHLVGLANVATVFIVLYAAEKYADLHTKLSFNPWILVFVLSIAAWRASLYLHAHPHLVAAFFRMT